MIAFMFLANRIDNSPPMVLIAAAGAVGAIGIAIAGAVIFGDRFRGPRDRDQRE